MWWTTAYVGIGAVWFLFLFGFMRKLFPRTWTFGWCALCSAFWPATLVWQIFRR